MDAVNDAPSTTLVILPGLDGTEVFFRPLLARLPESIAKVTVCFPTTGANDYDELFELVRAAVSGLSEFHVLGCSFGGPLAVMLAAAEPRRVRGIILSATFLRSPRELLSRFPFMVVAPVVWTARAIRRLPVWLFKSRRDPLRVAKAETWSRVPARVLAARVRALFRVDVRETLRRCAQPVLGILFEDDEVVPRNRSEEIRECSPSARLVTLPGDHLATFKDPASSAREIVRFLQDGAATGRDHAGER
jgi:pimeloyl-ACP methyl ester carboxylesterase